VISGSGVVKFHKLLYSYLYLLPEIKTLGGPGNIVSLKGADTARRQGKWRDILPIVQQSGSSSSSISIPYGEGTGDSMRPSPNYLGHLLSLLPLMMLTLSDAVHCYSGEVKVIADPWKHGAQFPKIFGHGRRTHRTSATLTHTTPVQDIIK